MHFVGVYRECKIECRITTLDSIHNFFGSHVPSHFFKLHDSFISLIPLHPLGTLHVLVFFFSPGPQVVEHAPNSVQGFQTGSPVTERSCKRSSHNNSLNPTHFDNVMKETEQIVVRILTIRCF